MPNVALVVDDSMLIRYSICRFLEERGFTVEAASNGAEALEILSRVQPDLVITDMQMPKMSGSELITALKSRPETAHVPIIIVTSQVSVSCESERVDFAIHKTIDVDAQLAQALDSLMTKKKSRAQAAGK